MRLVKNEDGSWRSWDSLRDDPTDKSETMEVVPVDRLKELDQYLVRSIKEERSNADRGVPGAYRVVDALRFVRTRLNSLFNGH
jgi:hypothetical protein